MNKSCQLDLAPRWLVKVMGELLSLFITLLVNKSLTSQPSSKKPSFDRPRREAVPTETEPTEDELPAHINLLYETTIAETRLTADVDRQFRDVLQQTPSRAER